MEPSFIIVFMVANNVIKVILPLFFHYPHTKGNYITPYWYVLCAATAVCKSAFRGSSVV